MNIQQEKYLRKEFLTLTINGALGRSGTYLKNVSDEQRKNFQDELKRSLINLEGQYHSPITQNAHCNNIAGLAAYLTNKYPGILRNGTFRIGVAQKALNLYLKYLWCSGLIPEPPHCPFDRIVINHLPIISRRNWTSISSITEYQTLVNDATRIASDHNQSLAEWELRIWT